MTEARLEFPKITEDLAEYLPLLSTGLNLLSASWVFPPEPIGKRRTVRVRLDQAMGAQLDYIVTHSKKSKGAVITAALIHAKNSKRLPPTRPSKKKGGEPTPPNDAG